MNKKLCLAHKQVKFNFIFISSFAVNVKGVRHERTSSFFDIPAVTHPYCYR